MSTQIYDLIDLNQSKSGLCIRKNNHYTNRAFRAEDEVRTRDPQLGRLMLYQLSYFRKQIKVGEDGFEPPKVKTSRFTVCPIWPLWYSPNCDAKVGKLPESRNFMKTFFRLFFLFSCKE